MTFSFETNGNLATNELECSICLLRYRRRDIMSGQLKGYVTYRMFNYNRIFKIFEIIFEDGLENFYSSTKVFIDKEQERVPIFTAAE